MRGLMKRIRSQCHFALPPKLDSLAIHEAIDIGVAMEYILAIITIRSQNDGGVTLYDQRLVNYPLLLGHGPSDLGDAAVPLPQFQRHRSIKALLYPFKRLFKEIKATAGVTYP